MYVFIYIWDVTLAKKIALLKPDLIKVGFT